MRESRVEFRDPVAPDPLTVEIDLQGGSPPAFRKLGRQVLPLLLNIRVQRVEREVDAYLLRVRPEARDRLLKAAMDDDAGALYSNWSSIGSAKFVSAPMEHVASVLERILEQPVVDATELEGRFDLEFKWTAGDAKSLRQALQKLGLDLVPTKKSVPFIVVEQAPGRAFTQP